MKILKSFVVCLLTYSVFFQSATLCAQQHPEDALLRPSSLLLQELAAGENAALVVQQGRKNQAAVVQMHRAGEELNLVYTEQQGNRNQIALTQDGYGNQAMVIQNGNRNSYEGEISGTGLTTLVIQEGNRNTVIQSLTESVDSQTELIQIGNDNEIIHVIDGAVNQSFQVIQEGNGQSIMIRQSY